MIVLDKATIIDLTNHLAIYEDEVGNSVLKIVLKDFSDVPITDHDICQAIISFASKKLPTQVQDTVKKYYEASYATPELFVFREVFNDNSIHSAFGKLKDIDTSDFKTWSSLIKAIEKQSDDSIYRSNGLSVDVRSKLCIGKIIYELEKTIIATRLKNPYLNNICTQFKSLLYMVTTIQDNTTHNRMIYEYLYDLILWLYTKPDTQYVEAYSEFANIISPYVEHGASIYGYTDLIGILKTIYSLIIIGNMLIESNDNELFSNKRDRFNHLYEKADNKHLIELHVRFNSTSCVRRVGRMMANYKKAVNVTPYSKAVNVTPYSGEPNLFFREIDA